MNPQSWFKYEHYFTFNIFFLSIYLYLYYAPVLYSGTYLLLGAHQKLYLQLKMSFYKVHDYPGWQLLIQMWNFCALRTAADFSDNSYFIPCSYHSKDWALVYLPMSARKNCLQIPNNCMDLPAKPLELVTAYKWRQCTKNIRLSFYSRNSVFTYFI